MKNILVLHGPNLNLLGTREPEVYGTTTLDQVNDKLATLAKSLNLGLATFQSNAEHELIDKVQQAKLQRTSFIIVNPAAFTHTSIALRDAFLATQIPFIEVHLSNIKSRESFRHHSYLSDIATGVIFGLGVMGYELALQAATQYLTKTN